jgi:hypothetical protein
LEREVGTDECADVGVGGSSEIDVGLDCSGDVEGWDRLRCYVLRCDSDCVKGSSEWTASAVVC